VLTESHIHARLQLGHVMSLFFYMAKFANLQFTGISGATLHYASPIGGYTNGPSANLKAEIEQLQADLLPESPRDSRPTVIASRSTASKQPTTATPKSYAAAANTSPLSAAVTEAISGLDLQQYAPPTAGYVPVVPQPGTSGLPSRTACTERADRADKASAASPLNLDKIDDSLLDVNDEDEEPLIPPAQFTRTVQETPMDTDNNNMDNIA
jgi:hypothetical protein